MSIERLERQRMLLLRRKAKIKRVLLMQPYQRVFYTIANAFARLCVPILVDFQVTGLENVPREGGFILVSNHTSWLDPILLGAYIPRTIVFMSKVENFHHPLLAPIVFLYGAFPVKRGLVDRQALLRCEEVLAAGGGLGMLPEGTRSRSGVMRRARAGAALVALRTGATILPVGIAGAHHGAFTPLLRLHRNRIRMRIGPPFTLPPPAEGEATRDYLQHMADEMMRRVAELLPPEQRGVYAGQPLQADR